MAEEHSIKVIARIQSDFQTKFGIPRQSGLVPELRARIVFEPEFRIPEAVRGLEGRAPASEVSAGKVSSMASMTAVLSMFFRP